MTKEEFNDIIGLIQSGGFNITQPQGLVIDETSLIYPTSDQEWIKLLNTLKQWGIKMYDQKTTNYNAPSTVFNKLVSKKLITPTTFDLQKYLLSDWWKQLTKAVLADNPDCEGNCGNKGVKIFIKNFDKYYHETRDDVVVLCKTCRLTKGQIYTSDDKRKMIEEAMHDPQFADIMKEAMREYIVQEARNLLRNGYK